MVPKDYCGKHYFSLGFYDEKLIRAKFSSDLNSAIKFFLIPNDSTNR